MNIYMSSGAFRERTVRGVIAEAQRLGVTHVELSSGLAHDPDWKASVADGMKAGLTFLVHNYFPAPADSIRCVAATRNPSTFFSQWSA